MLELGARGVEHLFVKSVNSWYLYINLGVENVLTETRTKRKGFLEQGKVITFSYSSALSLHRAK